MLRTLGLARDHFNFVSFRVFDDKWHEDQAPFSEAVVVIEGPDGVRTRNSAIGNGPVNALDSALRSALVAVLSGARSDAACRLQGSRARQRRRHRRARARADRIDRRPAPMGHGRSFQQRRRGELAGAGRFGRIQAAQGQREAAHRQHPPAGNGARPRERAVRCATAQRRGHRAMALPDTTSNGAGAQAPWASSAGCARTSRRSFDRDPAARTALEVMLAYPGLHAIWMYRVGALAVGASI